MSRILQTLTLLTMLSTSASAAVLIRPDNQIPLSPTPIDAALMTPAPTVLIPTTQTADCAGIVVTDDLSMPEPYCCVGGVYAVAPFALTKWFYNHTGASIPSTVVTPTTCVRPVPLTGLPVVGA